MPSYTVQVQSGFTATHICSHLFVSVTKHITAMLAALVCHIGRDTPMDEYRKKLMRLSLEDEYKALEMTRKGRRDNKKTLSTMCLGDSSEK